MLRSLPKKPGFVFLPSWDFLLPKIKMDELCLAVVVAGLHLRQVPILQVSSCRLPWAPPLTGLGLLDTRSLESWNQASKNFCLARESKHNTGWVAWPDVHVSVITALWKLRQEN